VNRRRPSRKQARRDALFVLYQHEVTSRPAAELLARVGESDGYEADEFTVRVVEGVLAELEPLDAVLAAHSRHWALERIAPLERSALRVGLFEIESGETPPEVAIDEAVRLVKRYSTHEAGALVNGILGAVFADRKEERG
jgi:N utilization substance protein B